jgi:hypothetical protein
MSAQSPVLCLGCGRPFPAALGFCPVCLLRRAGEEESDSLEPPSEETLQAPAEDSSGTRFEHYQLFQGPDGQLLVSPCT